MLDFADVLGHRLPKTPQVPKIGPVIDPLGRTTGRLPISSLPGFPSTGIRSITSLTGARL